MSFLVLDRLEKRRRLLLNPESERKRKTTSKPNLHFPEKFAVKLGQFYLSLIDLSTLGFRGLICLRGRVVYWPI